MVAKKLKIDMPIVNSIYQILFESAIPSVTLSSLMARELKAE
jgi:glycerol-3-phosphate dehydrogenase